MNAADSDRSRRTSRTSRGFALLTAFTLAGTLHAQPAIRTLSPSIGLFDLENHALGIGDHVARIGTPGSEPLLTIPFRINDPEHAARPIRFWIGNATQQPLPNNLTLQIGNAPPLPLTLAMDNNLEAPGWAMGAVWYQIFPERFRNGDPGNDPSGPSVARTSWQSDFSDITVDEIELAWSRQRAGDPRSLASFNRRGGSRRSTIFARRYGGDLIGVYEQLDHIKSLGVTAIYFCPVFASSSLHKYDAADFRHIDPTFGPVTTQHESLDTWNWTAADQYFLHTLLPAAKARGLRVIIDGVWNHTGTDHWAFRDVVERGRSSPYADWFRARFNDAGNLVGWTAWEGQNGNLPEFTQTPDGDLHPEVSEHIFEITRRWMDPNGDGDPSDGIDGWRLDVAPEIGNAFWSRWRAHVRSLNPDAILVGEIWFDAQPWFDGVAFDSQMNYPFAIATVEWASGAPRTSSQSLSDRLSRVFSHAPHTELVQMNLLGSHDTPRLLTMISRPEAPYDDGATIVELGRDAARQRPSADAHRRAMLAVAIQATALGAPMVYAGDELGVFGPDDPDNRKPIPWPDLDTPDNPDDAPDLSMLAAYQEWFTIRQHPDYGPIFRYGTIRFLDSGNPDLLIFERELNGRKALIAVNRGDSDAPLATLDHPFIHDLSDSRVPPLSARIYTSE
ncbi:MAG: hypothetical protein KF902_07835 [Phycisphaeraceae bacterium]|nr:hypothetical protein [Phycisphaeraceae bacterium]